MGDWRKVPLLERLGGKGVFVFLWFRFCFCFFCFVLVLLLDCFWCCSCFCFFRASSVVCFLFVLFVFVCVGVFLLFLCFLVVLFWFVFVMFFVLLEWSRCCSCFEPIPLERQHQQKRHFDGNRRGRRGAHFFAFSWLIRSFFLLLPTAERSKSRADKEPKSKADKEPKKSARTRGSLSAYVFWGPLISS